MSDSDYTRRRKTVTIQKKRYTFQELLVPEQDACFDASVNADGTFNARTNTRLMAVASSVEPKLEIAAFEMMPISVYADIVDAVRAVNSPEDADPNS